MFKLLKNVGGKNVDFLRSDHFISVCSTEKCSLGKKDLNSFTKV